MLGWFLLEAASVTRVLVCRHYLLFAFFRLLKCLRCLEGAGSVELSLFLLIGLLFAPLFIMLFVLLFVCWFPVGRLLLLRDWVGVYLQSCLTWFGVSLVYRRWGVPFWFGPKVWRVDQFWFEIGSQLFGSSLILGFLWFLSLDRRSRGGGSTLIFSDVAQLWCSGLWV